MQRSDDMAFYTCPRCGQNNPDTLTGCSKCGMPLSEFFPDTKPPVQPQGSEVSYYGAGVPPTMPYGNDPMQPAGSPYMPYPPNYGQGMPPKKNNTLVVVLVLVITALVIAGVIIAILLVNLSNSGSKEQSSAVSETTEDASLPEPESSVYIPPAASSEPSVNTRSYVYSEPSVNTPSYVYSEPSVSTPSYVYSEPSVDTPSSVSVHPSETTDESGLDVEKYIPYMKQKSQWSYFNDSRYANPDYKIPTPESCITTIKKVTSDYDTTNEYGLYYTYESPDTEDVIAYIVLLRALDYDFAQFENSENPDQSFFYFSKDDNIVLSFTIRTISSDGTIGMMIVRGDYE